MKMPSHEKSLIAWALYFSVLFSSLMCAMSLSQMAGLSFSGLDGQFCSMGAKGTAELSSDTSEAMLLPGIDCSIASLFSATLLAVFFSLFLRLVGKPQKHLPERVASRSPRHRWPLSNPRASPNFLPVL